jgi:hypothetical protein
LWIVVLLTIVNGAEAVAEEPARCLSKALRTAPSAGTYAVQNQLWACYAGPAVDDKPSGTCLGIDHRTRRAIGRLPWDDVRNAARRDRSICGTAARLQATVETTEETVMVCDWQRACSRIRPTAELVPAARNLAADVTFDGTRAFIIVPQRMPDGWRVYGDTYEVASRKRVARIQLTGLLGPAVPVFDSVNDPTWGVRWDRTHVKLFEGNKVLLVDPITAHAVQLQGVGTTFFEATWSRHIVVVHETELRIIDNVTLDTVVAWTVPSSGLTAGATATAWHWDDKGRRKIFITFADAPGFVVFDEERRTLGTPHALPICP